MLLANGHPNPFKTIYQNPNVFDDEIDGIHA
jgi:hypothetical protein